MATRAPTRANARAAAAPMPVDAPVMRTDLPARSVVIGSDMSRLLREQRRNGFLVRDPRHGFGKELRARQLPDFRTLRSFGRQRNRVGDDDLVHVGIGDS